MTGQLILEGRSLRKFGRASFAAGCGAMLVCAGGGLLVSPVQFFRAYLAVYAFFLGVVLGSMALLMLYHLTGGAWGVLIRRTLEAQANLVPLLAVLFVPIGFGIEPLYVWAQPDRDAGLLRQQFYLNRPFFLWRAAIYFAVWIATSLWLRLLSRRQDRSADPRLPWRMQRASEVGLVLYGTTIHFAAFDWIEMLDPSVHSTIFPFVVASGQVLSGQALALVVLAWLVRRTGLAETVSTRALIDLGNILLALLVIWAYMVWFQFMLIWIANLPADLAWILPRSRGGWLAVTWALFVGHFGIPFFLLLGRPIKRRTNTLAGVAGLVLAMQLVFDYYQVVPAFPASALREHWIELVMPLAIGGIWLAAFLHQLSLRPLLALHDPSRESALRLRSLDDVDAERERAMAAI